MKISCNVIRDLLPLYAEKLASPESGALIETHLSECADCQEVLVKLRAMPVISPETDTRGLERVEKSIRRRRRYAVLLAGFLVAVMLFGVFYFLNEPLYLSADEAIASVSEEDGQVIIAFKERVEYVDYVSAHRTSDPDSWDGTSYRVEKETTIQAFTRLANGFFGKDTHCKVEPLVFPDSVQRIWYVESGDGKEDVLLWGDPFAGGRVTLPGLVMNYYFLISLALGGTLGLAAVLLRKTKWGSWLLAAAAFFGCYALAVPVVTLGRFQTFHAPRAFLGAGILTLLLWGAACSAWKLRRMRNS